MFLSNYTTCSLHQASNRIKERVNKRILESRFCSVKKCPKNNNCINKYKLLLYHCFLIWKIIEIKNRYLPNTFFGVKCKFVMLWFILKARWASLYLIITKSFSVYRENEYQKYFQNQRLWKYGRSLLDHCIFTTVNSIIPYNDSVLDFMITCHFQKIQLSV